MKNVASKEARWIDVPGERLAGWVASFAVRHGGEPLTVARGPHFVTFTAGDGAVAECRPPFPESLVLPDDPAGPDELAAALAAHAVAPRTVGVLLARMGGYAAGVFTGYPPVLADSKVGSRLVHGRSAAGGWSQHRFARRREKQASEAMSAAADTAAAVFGRWAGAGPAAGRGPRLDAVVLGGDKRAFTELRGDPRLAPYLALAAERFITVPDPKRAVLEGAPRLYQAVRIRLTEPGP